MGRKIVFWFSGTGNSLHAAKKAAEAAGGAELIRMIDHLDGLTIEDADVLGFVMPVYAWGAPRVVENFLKTLVVRKSTYTFLLLTHGGMPGNAQSNIMSNIEKCGVLVDAGFDVRMVDNYVPFYNPPGPEKAAKLNGDADTVITDFCKAIATRQKNEPPSTFKGWLMSTLIHPVFIAKTKNSDKSFRVNEKCTACGICEKVCPVGNITGSAKKATQWNHACENCMACFHWCPAQAIQWKNKSGSYNRYHHPDSKAADFFRK